MHSPNAAATSKEVSPRTLRLFAVILFGFIVIFHLGLALTGRSIFRGNHLGAALEYTHGPINLLRPVITGFNAAGTPTALEFPLWQAAAGLLFKITRSTWYGWANIVSLLIFAAAPWPIFQLARQYVGERAAWWTVIFFLAQPVIIVYSGMAAADGLSIVAMIWFLYFADRMIRSGNAVWWIPSTLFAALSAVLKMPFFMAAGLLTVFLLLLNRTRAWRPWVLLATTGLFAAIIFQVWTHYTNHLAAQAEFPFKELRLSESPYIRFWYFGDLHYRLSPKIWAAAGWRFLHDFGALPMIALALVSLIRRGNALPKLWLLSTFIITLVFAQLVLRHWHYWLMCAPAMAMLCGATLARWEPFLSQEIPWKSVRLAFVSIVLLFSAVEGIASMSLPVMNFDPYIVNMAKVIRDHTQPTDRIVLFDRGFFAWGADALFRADREGLSVSDLHTDRQSDPNVTGLTELLNDPAKLKRLKDLGYNKLVLISESPLECAYQTVMPGNAKNRTRNVYPASISPSVDAWPVAYQTEDIIIKDIP